jgi:uncharacterized protein (TIGR00369 family)
MSVETSLPPYAAMLGLRREGKVLVMPYAELLVGSPGRLHGGSVAGLMEMAANLAVLDALAGETAQVKPVNVTVDYLREGALEDVFAEAFLMRIGRRVANVRVEAWQRERGRLIAAARMNMLIARKAKVEPRPA